VGRIRKGKDMNVSTSKHIIHIPSDVVNKWMLLAGYRRSWPTYGADVIEKVLHHFTIVPNDYLYQGFDPNTEMLSFALPIYSDRYPSRIDKIKQRIMLWIIKKLS
jgi:hypothetical protein